VYQEAIKRGSVAVVTGAANGVGKVAATRFAEAGLSVVTAETDVRAAAANGADAVANVPEAAFKAGEVALLMYNAGIVRPLS
jgi:NAD(P)-dependent dehydrogenase (short-subunit alcohol dehydrogenase family)